MCGGVEQRPAERELGDEDLLLRGPAVFDLAEKADVEQLPRVVPLIHGVREVDARVALQAGEARGEHLGHDLGGLGLADTGFALDEQRLLELQRQEDGRGETAIADVAALAEAPLDIVDARRGRHPVKQYRAFSPLVRWPSW